MEFKPCSEIKSKFYYEGLPRSRILTRFTILSFSFEKLCQNFTTGLGLQILGHAPNSDKFGGEPRVKFTEDCPL